MVEPVSPLGSAWRPGSHGNFADGAGCTLGETRPGSIVQVAAWPGEETAVIAAIKAATGLALPDGAGGGVASSAKSAFGVGPGKFLVVDQAEGLMATLEGAVATAGAVTDLSHGRTAIRLEGPRAEFVLAKLFAIDFSRTAFPVGSGRATQHHDIHAAIQRTGREAFDLYVFRSFARSFWRAFSHAAEEVGYVVK